MATLSPDAFVLSGLEERARAIGARAAARRREAVARDAEDVPGVTVRIVDEDVVIEGRALLDRWIADARLRYVGRAGG